MAKYGTAAASEDLGRINTLRTAIIAASRLGPPPSLIAAIISRETRGRPSFFIGDGGHGHGPMQIDDRYFPQWCAKYRANLLTDAEMIMLSTGILKQAFRDLATNVARYNQATGLDIGMRAGVAAYNCGVSRVRQALREGKDIDAYTTGANYSADVLERAVYFKGKGF